MMRAMLGGLAFIAFIEPAAAAHCGHHRIYRVSMGVCVGAHSRLAREVEIERPRRLERPREPLVYVTVTIPAGKAPEAQEPPPAADPDIPYSLPESRMWNPPRRFTPWVVP